MYIAQTSKKVHTGVLLIEAIYRVCDKKKVLNTKRRNYREPKYFYIYMGNQGINR